MTPAISAAERAGITFRVLSYDHNPATTAFGVEAAHALGVDSARVFKTLVGQVDSREFVVAAVPVARVLDLKGLARACGSKRAVLAEAKEAERATGYIIGGISPLGQRKRLLTVVDESAFGFDTIYVSAGKRGLELELSPHDLLRLTHAVIASIAR